jgi:hypothetical protein
VIAPDLHAIARRLQADLQFSDTAYAASALVRGEGDGYLVVARDGATKLRIHVSDASDLQSIAQSLSWLQTEVIEYQWAAWPTCTGHRHPLDLEVVDGELVWVCPSTGAPRTRLGDLSEAAG